MDSKGSDVNAATIPVIAELLKLLFLSDQSVSVCPISVSINFEFLIFKFHVLCNGLFNNSMSTSMKCQSKDTFNVNDMFKILIL